jgi:hypothetical protein
LLSIATRVLPGDERRLRPGHHGSVRVLRRAVVLIALAAASCSDADESSTPPRRDDAAGKVRAAIEEPEGLAQVPTEPLPGEGRVLCIDGEDIRLYLFDSDQDRAEAAALIDRSDPSHVGDAIVAWSGNPTFWEVDRALVLYLGGDEALLAELVSGLGEPYAAGLGRPGGGTSC